MQYVKIGKTKEETDIMNTLMTLAVADSCCVKVCKHCSQAATPSAWDNFINNLPSLFWGVIVCIVIVLLAKYGIEYYKINKENLKQVETEKNKRLSDIKSVLEGIYAETKNANASRTLLQQVEELKKRCDELNKQINEKNNTVRNQ